MSNEQPNNPLHSVTLEKVIARLVEHYGWDRLAKRNNINCFKNDRSLQPSLKFLRKTQWVRDKAEGLYISTFERQSLWGYFK
ncbi:MAG: VF530 family DNA-binding protein [Pseudomonadota bacterium]